MKIVVAVDSFKGSLTSNEAGKAIEEGIRRVFPDSNIVIKSMSDGGEGLIETLVNQMNGKIRTIKALDPLGKVIECSYGLIASRKLAVIEMAKVAGLTLVEPKDRNPLNTTTYGLGQMILDAIDQGYYRFIIGIGGSATNDGGIGMLQALGYKMLDINNKPVEFGAKGLSQLKIIDDTNVPSIIKKCEFMIACDVNNPLCGKNGASEVFALQKGASEQLIKQMDKWMLEYALLSKQKYNNANENYPGAGAAGGLGFAFYTYLNAKLQSGIDLVINEIDLENDLKDANLIITGEGRLDSQSVMGKVPIGVARVAKKYQLPVIAICGSVSSEAKICNEQGIDAYFSILNEVISLQKAMDKQIACKNMSNTVEQVFRLYKVSGGKK